MDLLIGSGFSILDTGFSILDAGFSILDAGYLTLDSRCGMLGIGCAIRVADYGTFDLDLGFQINMIV
jgi:hypothetical protein